MWPGWNHFLAVPLAFSFCQGWIELFRSFHSVERVNLKLQQVLLTLKHCHLVAAPPSNQAKPSMQRSPSADFFLSAGGRGSGAGKGILPFLPESAATLATAVFLEQRPLMNLCSPMGVMH